MKRWIKERIKENKNLFTKEELNKIDNNFNLVKKIYLLGFVNMQNSIDKY